MKPMCMENILGGWSITRYQDPAPWCKQLMDYLVWVASKVRGVKMEDAIALVSDDREATSIAKPYTSKLYGKVVIVPYRWLIEQPEYKAIHDDYIAEQAVKVLTQ